MNEDFRYYDPCGNGGPVEVDGRSFYRLLPEELARLDIAAYPPASAEGHLADLVVAGVAPPGPGDDVGTLTVFSDGMARFVSDNGAHEAWLIDQVRTYDWVC